MNKVISINLNGRAYQLEEAGFQALQNYLDQAGSKLGDNPDKEEIMADFEQAIADKCDHFLNPHKTVITAKEIEQIIQEMGPVNDENIDENSKEQKREKTSHRAGPKRFYLIREGALICGVCNGLAAYFNIDVNWVRLIFLVLTGITHGAWILVYFIMSIVVPYANTSEEKAEARGLPFNAQELLQRAREKYAHFNEEHKKYWKKYAKNISKEHQDYWQNWKKEQEDYWQNWKAERTQRPTGLTGLGSGVGAGIIAIVMVFFSLIWIVSLISVLTTGALFGFVFIGIPIWLVVVLLTCAYNIVLLPLRAMKAAMFGHGYYGHYYHGAGWFGLLDAIMWITILGIVCWLLWMYVPQTHMIWEKIYLFWQQNQSRFFSSTQQLTQQLTQQK